jgi:hypothetical protein
MKADKLTQDAQDTLQGVLVLISHTSKDKMLAEALNDLLESGLGLLAGETKSANVDEYSLEGGVNAEARLRDEVNAAKVLIGLITPHSLSSKYIMFELGARWGAGLPMVPLLAGVTTDEFRRVLSFLNATSINNDADLHQLLRDIGQHLKMNLQTSATYLKHLRNVKELADIVSAGDSGKESPRPSPAGSINDLRISFRIEGTPPSPQIIKVMANRPVTISCLEYLLPDEHCIASQECSLEGESLDVPLSQQLIDELYNAPRPAGSTYENSVKFRVTASAGGRTRIYTFRANLTAVVAGGTAYRRVAGSKDFVSSI